MNGKNLLIALTAVCVTSCKNGSDVDTLKVLPGLIGNLGGTLSAKETAAVNEALKAQTELKAKCESSARELKRASVVPTDKLAEGESKYQYATRDLDQLRTILVADIRSGGTGSVSEGSKAAAKTYQKSAQEFIDYSDTALGRTPEGDSRSWVLALAGIQAVWAAWTNYETQKREAYASAVSERLTVTPWSGIN